MNLYLSMRYGRRGEKKFAAPRGAARASSKNGGVRLIASMTHRSPPPAAFLSERISHSTEFGQAEAFVANGRKMVNFSGALMALAQLAQFGTEFAIFTEVT